MCSTQPVSAYCEARIPTRARRWARYDRTIDEQLKRAHDDGTQLVRFFARGFEYEVSPSSFGALAVYALAVYAGYLYSIKCVAHRWIYRRCSS